MTAVMHHPDGLGRKIVLEDPALPHQIQLVFTSQAARSGQIGVTCNCLPPGNGRGRPRQFIETRKIFTVADALAAWQAWHEMNAPGALPAGLVFTPHQEDTADE